MNRRQFLTLGVASAVVISTGATIYQQSEIDTIIDSFDDETTSVLVAIIPVLLQGTLPADAKQRKLKVSQVIADMQKTIATLPPATQAEIKQLFDLLKSRLAMLIFTGQFSHLESMSSAQKMSLLDAWRFSYLDMLKVAFSGLKELVFAAFYSNPDNWGVLNYQKPNIGR